MAAENSINSRSKIRWILGYVRGLNGWQRTLGRNYRIDFPETTSSVVSIIDKTSRVDQIARAQRYLKNLQKAATRVKNPIKADELAVKLANAQKALSKAKVAAPEGSPVLRLDGPHVGKYFDHININPGISGRPDPHIPLPPGGLQAGTALTKCARVLDQVNKVAVPVAIAVNTVQVGYSMFKDYQHGTTRNTVETATDLVGGWGGGYGGAIAGAAAGSALFPGIGTIVGGVFGAISGGIGGSTIANVALNSISDRMGYDITEIECTACGIAFTYRIYCEEERGYCQECLTTRPLRLYIVKVWQLMTSAVIIKKRVKM